MTPEDRVREFWEKRETPLSVASITELIRAAENDALERAAKMFLEWHDGYAAAKIRELKHPSN